MQQVGARQVTVIRLPVKHDSLQARKVLAADNTLPLFALDDDRALSELLKQIHEEDQLLGTGYDDMSLAALAMVTRHTEELEDFDAAAEWVGMPEFDGREVDTLKLVLHFEDEETRAELVDKLGLFTNQVHGRTLSARYPPKENDDRGSVMWEAS